jgi:hypothetical protein
MRDVARPKNCSLPQGEAPHCATVLHIPSGWEEEGRETREEGDPAEEFCETTTATQGLRPRLPTHRRPELAELPILDPRLAPGPFVSVQRAL